MTHIAAASDRHRRFGGVIPPLVTPLTPAGDLDTDSLGRLIEHVFDGGASGVFLLGSTGEGTSFTIAEREQLIGAAVQHVAGRGPVLAGVLAPSTALAAELCRSSIDAGADALVAAAPFYVATHPVEVEQHYRLIAEVTGEIPLLAYDIPVRAGSKLPADVVLRLAEDTVIAGVKDSSGVITGLRKLILERERLGLTGFSILTGSENTADLCVLLGVDGIIPGLGNVEVATFVNIIELVRAGELEKAELEQQRLLTLMEVLGVPDQRRMSSSSASIGAVKGALQVLGVIDSVQVAPPLLPIEAAEIAGVREVLIRSGVLQVSS
ncbi:dihydrodipicolinate synthase family protein [Microlunatus elymi]|uniref:dihydrodipicolinate synthase family protein n=1 Tax=Microlunatus elymi TaxID=2596828 RepID=UPI00143E0AFE|nr:dihydrodipicolinate synthase family protein [Microlunatus elymi]